MHLLPVDLVVFDPHVTSLLGGKKGGKVLNTKPNQAYFSLGSSHYPLRSSASSFVLCLIKDK